MKSLKPLRKILVEDLGYTESQAEDAIKEAKEDLKDRLVNGGEDPFDICHDHFNLEPDYLDEIVPL